MSKPLWLIVLLACGLFVSPAFAQQERINSFISEITVNEDASLSVIETIVVTATGSRIKRGIYRDFPTDYKDRLGNRVQVSLDVTAVRRDGRAELYRLESLPNGIRIRIGEKDVLLGNGTFTYQIEYRSEWQLGFFEDFDELYWNVTGNGWGFAIDNARAEVRLPGGAQAIQHRAYTGRQGATGSDFRHDSRGGIWSWETTRVLAPGEGLTIAIAWPKGYVTQPSNLARGQRFIKQNVGVGFTIAGTLGVFWFYLLAWRKYGKDPVTGAIIPRFKSPPGLSPAAVRFIRLMSFDKKAFSAAIINMAVKGYLTIEEEDDSFRLRKMPGASEETLTHGERKIAKSLLYTDDSILLDHQHHKLMRGTVRRFRDTLETEYEKAHFARNTQLFIIGMISTGVVMIVAAMLSGGRVNPVLAVLIAAIAAAIAFAGLHFFGEDTDPTFKIIPFSKMPAGGKATFLFQIAIALFVFTMNAIGITAVSLSQAPFQSICFALLGILNILFFFLLRRPTLAGRAVMDEIEGFRMYMKTAEEERLKFFNPPEKTPELFESLLPYAMALDVENEWNDKFAAVLAASATEPDQQGGGYRPRWYRGTQWQPGKSGLFTQNLGASLGAAVASSVSPPGRSSGSGGGGFSGGGGGGGGGGGW